MDKVIIGKITNSHGIRGEVKVAYEDEQLFSVNQTVYVIVNGTEVSLTIAKLRKHKHYLLITFEGYSNINEILQYKGLDIYAARQSDAVYLSDLVGYTVCYQDLVVGVVTKIFSNNAQDVLVLDTGVMIPYVDFYIASVSDSLQKIEINIIEGLINED